MYLAADFNAGIDSVKNKLLGTPTAYYVAHCLNRVFRKDGINFFIQLQSLESEKKESYNSSQHQKVNKHMFIKKRNDISEQFPHYPFSIRLTNS